MDLVQIVKRQAMQTDFLAVVLSAPFIFINVVMRLASTMKSSSVRTLSTLPSSEKMLKKARASWGVL